MKGRGGWGRDVAEREREERGRGMEERVRKKVEEKWVKGRV